MPLTKSEKDLQVSTQRRPAAENAAMGTLSAPAVSAFQLKADEEDQIQLKSTVQFEMEEEEVLQGKFILQRAESVDEEEPLQMKKPAANQTGLPDQLKSGIENLSGHSLDDVKVHYNSASPAQLNAHAYAQGTDIHVAPGQEQHLPHEAWHVVQQKQGRVQPTMQLKDSIVMNDDPGLEEEADLMGAKALQMKKEESGLQASQPQKTEGSQHLISLQPSAIVPLVQRVILHEDDTPMTDEELNALIGSYSDKIQNIIRDMHLEEGGGFSLEQAIEIASELANETEESPEDDIPDYARELLGEDIASEDDIDYVDEELMSSSSVKKPRKKKGKGTKRQL